MIFNDNILDFISENFYVEDFFDKKFLTKLREYFVKEINLGDRVKTIEKGSPLSLSNTFVYFSDKKLIKYYIFNIKHTFKCFCKDYEIDFDDAWNFYFYQMILHEFTHPYQDLIRKELSHDNSSLLNTLRHSDRVVEGDYRIRKKYMVPLFIRKKIGEHIYNAIYSYIPDERHAQAVSYDTMLKIYSRMFPDKESELLVFSNMFADEMYLGYEDIEEGSCSLREFYKYIKREDIFNDLDFSSYNSHERYLYGMPLSLEELVNEEKRLGIRK